MMKEGQGYQPPSPIKVEITDADLRLLRDVAQRREAARRYRFSSDSWRRGLTKNSTLIGLVGEHAGAVYITARGFPCAVDLSDRPNGDGGVDLMLPGGLGAQVRTRQGTFDTFLLKRGDRFGQIVPFISPLFIFAQWNQARCHEAFLCGWQWTTQITRELSRFAPSPKAQADHWNTEIHVRFFLPMCRLIDELKARQK